MKERIAAFCAVGLVDMGIEIGRQNPVTSLRELANRAASPASNWTSGAYGMIIHGKRRRKTIPCSQG